MENSVQKLRAGGIAPPQDPTLTEEPVSGDVTTNLDTDDAATSYGIVQEA